MADFDVLIPLYRADKPEIFDQAYQSILKNTLKPQKVVLVIDGPIPKKLQSIVQNWQEIDSTLCVVRLPENYGIVTALNIGLRECTSDYVIRCDSDDINVANRFSRLIESIVELKCDVLGSEIVEVDDNRIERRKIMPLDHSAIVRYSRFRNPINHMSVIFRRSKISGVGGYPNVPAKEDYALWLTCLQNGFKLANLAEPLVMVNLGSNFEARRKKSAFSNEFKLLKHKNEIGFDSYLMNFFAFLVRVLLLMSPSQYLRIVYALLRN